MKKTLLTTGLEHSRCLLGRVLHELHKRKAFLIILLKYGLGIVLLAYVIGRNWAPANQPGLSAVWQKHVVEHQPVDFHPFALACAICLTSMLITFVRWYVLVRAQDLPFTLPNALRLGLIGYYLSAFLPGSIGGDIIKATFLAREQSRRTVAVATVLIDRAIGLWGLCWLVALLGTTFWAGGYLHGAAEAFLKSIVIIALVIVAGSVGVWFLLGILPPHRAARFAGRLGRLPKVGHAAAEFWRAVWIYRSKGRSILIALLLSLVGHVGFVLIFYLAALTLLARQDIPSLAEHFLIVPVGMTAQAGFPTPGGVGAGQAFYSWLYGIVGYSVNNGVLASLVQQCITWGLGLVGYIVYLRMRPALAGTVTPAGEPLPADDAVEPEEAVPESAGAEQEIAAPGTARLVSDP